MYHITSGMPTPWAEPHKLGDSAGSNAVHDGPFEIWKDKSVKCRVLGDVRAKLLVRCCREQSPQDPEFICCHAPWPPKALALRAITLRFDSCAAHSLLCQAQFFELESQPLFSISTRQSKAADRKMMGKGNPFSQSTDQRNYEPNDRTGGARGFRLNRDPVSDLILGVAFPYHAK